MSMNFIGKFLVLLHTAASLAALGCAAAIYLQVTDWGWKEPRKVLDARIASEYDKRAAAVKEAIQVRDMVLPGALPAQTALREAELSFGVNHLFYVDDLQKLRTGGGDLEIKEVTYKDGKPALDSKGKNTGKPVLDAKVEGLGKSYAGYMEELKALQEKIDQETKEVRTWTEKAKDITFALTGKDDTGKVVKTGLYELLNNEKEAQDLALFEKEYLRPRWARALEEAELLGNREARLQVTLGRLLKKK